MTREQLDASRTLHSNCEHSYEGLFRVHLTEADYAALLREARGSVLQHKERLLDCDHEDDCTCDLAAQKIGLLARIDAALAEGCPDCGHQYGQQEYCQGDGHAEHADSATPVVEWKTEMGLHATTVNGVNIAVFPMTEDGKWTAALHVAEPFTTLDEAQRAAIAAARGMR